MTAKRIYGLVAALALMAPAATAWAGSDLDDALANGAQHLDADGIAERLVGNTVTFVTASGDKTFLVYYAEGNELAGRMVGGTWSDTGYYGITDANTICLSWDHRDKPRLRCWDVALIDGEIVKFAADGSRVGSVTAVEAGNRL